jgi:transposase
MKRFIEGADRSESTLLPECLDDWIEESNPVRAVDTFVDALDPAELGSKDVEPAATGRPGYHPAPLLKLYIYGYLNHPIEPTARARGRTQSGGDLAAAAADAG